MVGSYYLKTEYAVRVGHVMSATEAAIGATVTRELGLPVKVRLLDEAEVSWRALGYNGFFAFSHEIAGQQVFYTLERDSVELVDHVYRIDRLPYPDIPLPTTLDWQRLFPQFRDRGPALLPTPAAEAGLPARHFFGSRCCSRPGVAPPVPPPEFLG
jgi:hypothetical protein